jgi:hypothetical protein
MARKSSQGKELKKIASELIYTPTTSERKLKAKFWAKAAENPLISFGEGQSITLEQVRKMAGGGAKLEKAWTNPSFRNWFLDIEDGKAKLEYLFDLGLDAIEGLLLSDDPKTSSAKVNALKLLADLTGKIKRADNTNGLQKAIASADKASLEALFESAGLSVSVSASKNNSILIEPEEN